MKQSDLFAIVATVYLARWMEPTPALLNAMLFMLWGVIAQRKEGKQQEAESLTASSESKPS